MQSLANVLSALQRELGAAQNLQFPGGVSMQPDRAVISFRFAAQEKPGGDVQFSWTDAAGNPEAPSANYPHTLTIEFKAVVAGANGHTAYLPAENFSRPIPKSEAVPLDRIKEALSLIFGQPGFDSSARATVFREAFAELSAEQAQMVISSISGSAPEGDDVAKRSRVLLLKLARSAPIDSPEQAIAILAEILNQHPLDSILGLVAREWKTQEDWL